MMPVRAETPVPASGLTAAQVAQRRADGRTNAVPQRTSRTVPEIVRANVLTFFNGLLLALFVVVATTGRWQNGLFGLVIVANAAIGIVQELRAKRTLDRLALLNAPVARVVRDGVTAEIEVSDVVADDLMDVRIGDQVTADGTVLASNGLELDESLLTGEADPVAKSPGDPVLSGSIAVAGSALVRATNVGPAAYAARLAEQARRFTLTQSELVAGTTRLLRWIALLMLVVGPAVLVSQFFAKENKTWQDAVTGAVAALVGMVPEGLVLLTSLAFVVATVTLARQQTLVQELPAVEGLARVDVVCLDKTGTLTHGDVRFDALQLTGTVAEPDVAAALGLFAADAGTNPTATAVARQYPRSPWTKRAEIPFSSARTWAAVSSAEGGHGVLGAPEMLIADASQPARVEADARAAAGSRVLLLARAAALPVERDGQFALPALEPAALVVLAENLRDDAAQTLRYFTEQGVRLKVISGDNPRTVGAVAAAVGVPGVTDAADAVDARTLPDDPAALSDALEAHSAFGRVTPHQKRAIVAALQSRGHVVAMTGDGVNDALARKDADIGVAMGSGSAATRAVAQIVLLDGRFAHLPQVVAEGRRVTANIERAANLFLVKNVYSLLLALVSGATLSAYPLAPIQLTLISTLTIGVPGFVLALAPNTRRYQRGFLRRIVRFAVPVGLTVGATAYLAYRLARYLDPSGGVTGARTTATVAVLAVALWTLLVLARPLAGWKLVLVAGLAGVVALVLAVPVLAGSVFLLHPTPLRLVVAAAAGAVGAAAVELAARLRRNN